MTDVLNIMDAIAISLGYTVMAAIAVCIVAGVAIGTARLSNRAQHALLESLGGWTTFLKYREWYYCEQAKKEAEKGV